MTRTVVLYHGQCLDGFTAAWAAWRKYGEHAEYHPCIYGKPMPVLDLVGADVLLLDFSYPREALLAISKVAASLTVLDHHVTAQKDLEGLPFCVFDMNRSGAGIAWDVLHDGVPRPKLIDYVEDRDLWRFALPSSQLINAFVGSFDQTWENWNILHRDLDGDAGFRGAEEQGLGILRAQARYVAEMSQQASMRVIGGYLVPVVNAPYINTSELVGHLAETHPEAAFAAGWFQRADGMYQYSLRSKNGFDVALLAEQFGGGGHKAAAGFSVRERVDGAVQAKVRVGGNLVAEGVVTHLSKGR